MQHFLNRQSYLPLKLDIKLQYQSKIHEEADTPFETENYPFLLLYYFYRLIRRYVYWSTIRKGALVWDSPMRPRQRAAEMEVWKAQGTRGVLFLFFLLSALLRCACSSEICA